LQNTNNKSIFVTGGTGFLGSYLLRYLVAEGYTDIRALKRPNSPMDLVREVADKIEWIEGNILDTFILEDAMDGVQQVYHCAGIVSYAPSDYQLMMDVNAEGTTNMVNVALYRKVEKFVYVSSIASIGRRPKLPVIDENTKWERSNWNSSYAISKYLGEMEVWRGVAEGLNVGIVNPAVIIGSGFWDRGTGQLFERANNGLKFYPKGSTGYVDVRDVARFMVKLMDSDIQNERYILNGANSSYLDFFTKVAAVLNKKPPSIQVNFILKELAIAGEWLRSTLLRKKPLLTRHTVNHVNRDFVYKNEKSKAAFDFDYTPLEQTLAETGEQFLASQKRKEKAAVLPI
jgi:nucleoside-diphosphate-sugar epimerase